MTRITLVVAVTLALLVPTAASAAGAQETLSTRHARVVEQVKQRVDDAALQREVDALLDYRALAQDSLGGPARYAEQCGARCADFEAALTRLIRDNYLRRLRTEREHKVEQVGEEVRAKGVLVKTLVSFTKEGKVETLAVDYLMHEVEGRWLVRDIITDGVSLARNYKYEFGQILKKDGIDGLIARLEAKTAELAKN